MTEWAWATSEDFATPDILVLADENEAIMLAARIGGGAIKVADGFVIKNRHGAMVTPAMYPADLIAVRKYFRGR